MVLLKHELRIELWVEGSVSRRKLLKRGVTGPATCPERCEGYANSRPLKRI